MIMLNVLEITAPIFTLIAIGYLAVLTSLIPAGLLPGLARFVLYLCVPSVILSNFLRETAPYTFDLQFLKLYGIIAFSTLILGFVLQRFILGSSSVKSSIYAMGGSVPNSMFVGFPILLQATPAVAAQVLVMCLLVENLILTPCALLIADINDAGGSGTRQRIRLIAKRVITNPMLIAICFGVGVSYFEITPPQFILNSFDMLAKAATAAALVFIGGSLVETKFRGDLGAIFSIAALKLLLMPGIALFVIFISGQGSGDDSLSSALVTALILICASPMMSIFPIIASKYGLEKVTASSLLVTTALSFLTLNGFLAWVLR